MGHTIVQLRDPFSSGSMVAKENPGACIASLGRPAVQEEIKAPMARGFHQPGDVENRLGYYVGQIARQGAGVRTPYL